MIRGARPRPLILGLAFVATVASLASLVSLVGLEVAVRTVALPARLHEPPSTVVEYRDGTPMHVFLSPDEQWRIPVDLDRVDPDYLRALVRLEDKRFWSHGGVDVLAIGRAAVSNVVHGEIVSGASTITMQLARLLEPRPRTLRSKAVEAFRALQLERVLSKREILERYLERVPYGGNREGVETAAWAYFGHAPAALTASEVAILLAVPQAPSSRGVGPRNSERLRVARDGIAAELLAEAALEPDVEDADPARALAAIRRTPVPRHVRSLPRDAQHAARWLAARAPGPAGPRIATTLDREVQLVAEGVLQAARAEARANGIHNAAVVVLDHDAGEVRALVGNFDFWDEDHGGQIPGFDRRRSPGSALKPLIYALAIDRGLALPEFLVADVPVRYASYAPRNFDERFRGPVRLEAALSSSLNIPFVELLEDVGVERFLDTLARLGVAGLVDEIGYYGLSAAIGAVEVTPLEIAQLYAVFATDGTFRRARWTPRSGSPPPERVLAPGAVHLTRRALSRKDRPDFPSRRRLSAMPTGIHWKTGTSFGHRDAWAVGSNAHHTVAVWLGNFDRAPSQGLVGAEAAGPVLFDLLEALTSRHAPVSPSIRPRDLIEVQVCEVSGRLPTEACPRTRTSLAIGTRVPHERCPYHVRHEIDVATGLRVTPGCREGRETVSGTFVVWPTRLRRWIHDEHRVLRESPPLSPGCEPDRAAEPPRIVSPPPGLTAVLIPGVPEDRQQIPLEAEAGASRLSWFANGAFLGSARAEERMWWTPAPGQHEIVVVDDAGRRARRMVRVRGG